VNLRQLMRSPDMVREVMETLLTWCAKGEIRPEPGRVVSLEDAGLAHRMLEKRSNVGKIVIRLGD
jgi:NADPH:quinone reductase-like Zn-dependent oxidoreductase